MTKQQTVYLRHLHKTIFRKLLPDYLDFYIGECNYCGAKYMEDEPPFGIRFYRYCALHRNSGYYTYRVSTHKAPVDGIPDSRPGKGYSYNGGINPL